MIFISTAEYVFLLLFYSLIQPNLEEDVSTESLLANKKLRSNVWKEFELIMLDDGTSKAICKHCKKDFVAGNRAGTSHLKYHTGVCPKIQLSKRRKFGSPKLDIPIFDQQRSRDDFFRMVLAHGYSFNMSEHYYTRIFLYNLQPAKRILDDYRCNLHLETIEAIMCSHDWLKGRIPGAYLY